MNNTLLKGLAVLELLSRSERALSLTQIGHELQIAKSHVHRLMQALVETGFVVRDEDAGTYIPSVKLWELGSAVLCKLDLRRRAERQMQQLMDATGESVHLSVLDGTEVVYVHKLDSLDPVRAYTQIGGRVPAHCVATGKAQLAFGRAHALQAACDSLRPHTSRTITDRAEFLQDIDQVRSRGFAINRGEWREAVWGIAAPILDSCGYVIAAIGISGPASRFRDAVLATWSEAVVGTASEISDALGGRSNVPTLSRLRLGNPPSWGLHH
jgi:DNA-binding IclR family transcriptional regulator